MCKVALDDDDEWARSSNAVQWVQGKQGLGGGGGGWGRGQPRAFYKH